MKKDKIPDPECNNEWEEHHGICEKCGVNYAGYDGKVCWHCYYLFGGEQWKDRGLTTTYGKAKIRQALGSLGTLPEDWTNDNLIPGYNNRFHLIISEDGAVIDINYRGYEKVNV